MLLATCIIIAIGLKFLFQFSLFQFSLLGLYSFFFFFCSSEGLLDHILTESEMGDASLDYLMRQDLEAKLSAAGEARNIPTDKEIYYDIVKQQSTKQQPDLGLKAKEMQSDLLSSATRFAGVGYNYIRGSPEGDFATGGRDPGVLITRRILKFTYTQGKQATYLGSVMNVPDQVVFQPENSCLQNDRTRAYSGAQSYQQELAGGVSAEGM